MIAMPSYNNPPDPQIEHTFDFREENLDRSYLFYG